MSEPTILLVSWGRGNGHITRLLTIGNAFGACGWQVDLLTHQDPLHESLVRRSLVDLVHAYPDWAERADPWTEWASIDFLRRSVEFDRALLRARRPHRVVHDNRLSMTIACLLEDVPFVSLCQDNQMRDFSYDGTRAPIWTDSIDAINRVLVAGGLEPVVDDVRELFERGRIAVPSSVDLDPVHVRPGLDIVHTGVLQHLSQPRASASSVLFYRTVGVDTGPFVEAFRTWPGRLLIATGDTSRASEIEEGLRGTRGEVAPLWDLSSVGADLRAAVHHGGHGITTAMLAAGVPAVVLPGHNPERRANGTRAASRGAAVVLDPIDDDDAVRWGPAVDQTGDRPPWSDVRAAVESMTNQRVMNVPSRPTAAELVRLLC